MKKIIGLVLFAFLCTCYTTYAQQDGAVPTMAEADAVERQLLKDSLQAKDNTIDKVFEIRNSYLSKSAGINSDKQLTTEKRKKALEDLCKQTNKDTEKAMGKQLFDKYLELIQSRTRLEKNGKKKAPLASAD